LGGFQFNLGVKFLPKAELNCLFTGRASRSNNDNKIRPVTVYSYNDAIMSSQAPQITKEMQSFFARYRSFESTQRPSKRRASSQAANSSRKRGADKNVFEWPHERPTGEAVST
jgi:hypothetical protein